MTETILWVVENSKSSLGISALLLASHGDRRLNPGTDLEFPIVSYPLFSVYTASMEMPGKNSRKRRPWGLFSARFPPHSILQGNVEVQYPYHFCTATLSRTVLRLNPIPYCKPD